MGNVLLESPEKQTPKEGKFHRGFLVVPTTHLKRIHHKLTQNANFAKEFRCIGFVEFQDFSLLVFLYMTNESPKTLKTEFEGGLIFSLGHL
jgi:hypothetical protein